MCFNTAELEKHTDLVQTMLLPWTGWICSSSRWRDVGSIPAVPIHQGSI